MKSCLPLLVALTLSSCSWSQREPPFEESVAQGRLPPSRPRDEKTHASQIDNDGFSGSITDSNRSVFGLDDNYIKNDRGSYGKWEVAWLLSPAGKGHQRFQLAFLLTVHPSQGVNHTIKAYRPILNLVIPEMGFGK